MSLDALFSKTSVLPARLEAAREFAGLRVGQAAKQLKCEAVLIHAHEAGKVPPTDAELDRYAALYGLSLDVLLRGMTWRDDLSPASRAQLDALPPDDREEVLAIAILMGASGRTVSAGIVDLYLHGKGR